MKLAVGSIFVVLAFTFSDAATTPRPGDTSGQRAAAIASLKAVRSALAAGANLDDFRSYEIKARIKVDDLADTPKNRPLREIADIYSDVVVFSTVRVTGEIGVMNIEAAKKRYQVMVLSGDDQEQSEFATSITKALDDMTGKESSIQWDSDSVRDLQDYRRKRNQIRGEQIASLLILAADIKLSAVLAGRTLSPHPADLGCVRGLTATAEIGMPREKLTTLCHAELQHVTRSASDDEWSLSDPDDPSLRCIIDFVDGKIASIEWRRDDVPKPPQ